MSEISGKPPTLADFSAQVNTGFWVQKADGSGFEIQLEKLNDLVSNEHHQNFSLLFRAPAEVPLEQSVYNLMHKSLGEMDIFLVPVKKDESGVYFEAVFNLVN